MSELKLVSPLLDGFAMGYPISDRDGIRCCPALKENTDEKYIVKIISVPASQVQLDALLLTGAYKDPSDAMDYFKAVADSITAEVETLNTLAKLEDLLPMKAFRWSPWKRASWDMISTCCVLISALCSAIAARRPSLIWKL